ncbi:hypothetical protein B7463_g11929, partial [Scytalidium lignicola]
MAEKLVNGDSNTGSHSDAANDAFIETLPDDCVFIAGGGPVGLTLAVSLSYYGIKSLVLERNDTTTRWPKMDLTNARSTETFRKLGLVDSLREQGVPSHVPYRCTFCTGIRGKLITEWKFPSVDEWRKVIAEKNDGSQPLEPWQRLSQIIFEAWLKDICDKDPLIDLRFGWKVESAEERDEGIRATATDKNGNTHTFNARYGVGCDGASSRIRRSLGIPLIGGPAGLDTLSLFISNLVPSFPKMKMTPGPPTLTSLVDVSVDDKASDQAIFEIAGGNGEPYKLEIDNVLVRSTYRPNLVVATQFMGPKRHLFLAGDAVHQNIPTGGYGMNMGLADAFSIATKLAGVLHGYGGSHLLESYQQERWTVALLSVERAGYHLSVHQKLNEILAQNCKHLDADSEQGRNLRREIHEYYQKHDGENKDLGVEMAYIYHSKVIIPEDPSTEPKFNPRNYVPSTWPGIRAPHVYLQDGTAIFDLYGKHYTLVNFSTRADHGAKFLTTSAEERGVPLKHLELQEETNAREIWGKDLVLIRPDGHVGWRGDSISDMSSAIRIIKVVVGIQSVENGPSLDTDLEKEKQRKPFPGTKELFIQYPNFKVEKLGAFQQ